MRFRVTGADRENGAEATWEIECGSAEQARSQANAAGYLVSSVQPCSDAATPRDTKPQRAQIVKRVLIGTAAITIVLSAWLLGHWGRSEPRVAQQLETPNQQEVRPAATEASTKRNVIDWGKSLSESIKLGDDQKIVEAWINLGFVKQIDCEAGTVIVDHDGWSVFKATDGGRDFVLKILCRYVSAKNNDRAEKLVEKIRALPRYQLDTVGQQIQEQIWRLYSILVFEDAHGQSVGSVDHEGNVVVFR